MANKFNFFVISLMVILIIAFGFVSYKLNEKNSLLSQELQKVKNDYATKAQVSEIIFEKIDSCSRIQVTKNNWNFNSGDIYARDVCQAIGKSCFTATWYAMEASSKDDTKIGEVSQNAFAKGNFGCSMSLSKEFLNDSGNVESYEVVCC